MKKTKLILMGLISGLFAGVGTVQAVVILSDSFIADATGDAANGIYKHGGGTFTQGVLKNSPNSDVVAQGFSGNWSGTGYVTAQPGVGTDGYANIRMQNTASAYRSLSDYSSNHGNTYYFSMTVSVDALLSASQSAYFGFGGDLTTLPAEGITKYGFLLGIESDGSTMSLISRTRQSDGSPANTLKDTVVTSISSGKTYNLIVRLDRNISGTTDGFCLWINPTDATEGSNAAALVFNESTTSKFMGFLNQNDINTFALYSGGSDEGNIANVMVDNVMMATTWDDVYTNVIPEPATVGIILVGGLGMLTLRRIHVR